MKRAEPLLSSSFVFFSWPPPSSTPFPVREARNVQKKQHANATRDGSLWGRGMTKAIANDNKKHTFTSAEVYVWNSASESDIIYIYIYIRERVEIPPKGRLSRTPENMLDHKRVRVLYVKEWQLVELSKALFFKVLVSFSFNVTELSNTCLLPFFRFLCSAP